MSKSTPNLGLFEYDPNTDGEQTFNIRLGLNENWDKLDAFAQGTAGAAAAVQGALDAHTADQNNPHGVTAEQVAFLGNNPTKSVKEDTTGNWVSFGTGYANYNEDGTVADKPSTWGLLINVVWASEVFQIWNCQPEGPMLIRSGNAGGWGSTWQQIATTADLAGYLPLSGGALSGALTARGLTLSDYSTPFECSAFIDLHFPGTTEDFSGRIYVDESKQLTYIGASSGIVITSGNIGSYLSGCAKIEVGSYVGTGEATKSLVLPFSPKFLKIYTIDGFINNGYSRIGVNSTSYWIAGMKYLAYISTADASGAVGRPITVDGNTVSWALNSYASSSAAEKAKQAMNAANYTYHYVAFG